MIGGENGGPEDGILAGRAGSLVDTKSCGSNGNKIFKAQTRVRLQLCHGKRTDRS